MQNVSVRARGESKRWCNRAVVLASFGMLGFAHAGGKPLVAERGAIVSTLAGQWEIVRVLTRNDEWTPGAPRPDDPRELGQTIEIAADRLTFSHISAECKPLPAKGALGQVSIRKLFSGRDEPGKNDTVIGDIRGRLNGRARDYGPDIARERAVTLMKVQCGGDQKNQSMPWPDNQNWIAKPARLADTLLWSREPNSLMLLQRSPAKRTEGTVDDAACRQATSPTERTICGNPYLHMLHRYAESPERFIRTIEAKLATQEKQIVAEMPAARNACGADEACLRERLLQQVHYLMALEDRYVLLPR